MEEAARVYARALFEVAKERGKLDEIGEQLGQFADALEGSRELRVFFFSPYFSSAEKIDGLRKAVSGAEPELVNFLELLIEKHRMTEIFRIRGRFEQLWKQEKKRLDVSVTSAVELDPAVLEKIESEIERQTGDAMRQIEHLERHAVVEAVDAGDPVGHGQHRPDLGEVGALRVHSLDPLPEDRCDLVRLDLHLLLLPP